MYAGSRWLQSHRPFQPLVAWLAIGFVLHLAWEIAQLPLYTIWRDAANAFIAFAVFHCLLGDVAISTVSYIASAALLRNISWPIARPWLGALVATAVGTAYTAWSEWYNVYRAAAWQYMPSMPLLFGIGLAPLAQWIFVPVTTVAIVRRLVCRRTA